MDEKFITRAFATMGEQVINVRIIRNKMTGWELNPQSVVLFAVVLFWHLTVCRHPGVLWVTVLWRWQMKPQLRGVSAKSTEKPYQEPIRYVEHLLFTVAMLLQKNLSWWRLLRNGIVDLNVFLTAHKIQVKSSHLWETRQWVSPNGEVGYQRWLSH